MNLIDRLTKVFQNVFHDDSIVLNSATTSDDVDEWDSFSHINLIIAIELEFDITFEQNEALTFENVGELIQYIEEKVK